MTGDSRNYDQVYLGIGPGSSEERERMRKTQDGPWGEIPYKTTCKCCKKEFVWDIATHTHRIEGPAPELCPECSDKKQGGELSGVSR